MAVTPGDRMGLGEGHFKVNRPTEIRPVMPNQVIEGDRILTLSEANGRRCNPEPRAKVFDETANYLGSLPFPNRV